MKKLKDNLLRGLTDEQISEYITKLESNIGTNVNQAAFAQVTGANN
jgi:peptidyl-prolyl cis-trans isomerase D